MTIRQKIALELRRSSYGCRAALAGIRDPRPHFPGLLSYDEGLLLARLARRLPPKAVMVEIGCFRGLSSAYLLEGSKRNHAFLYSIDPFDSDLAQQKQDATNPTLAERKPSRDQVARSLHSFGHDRFELIQGFSHEVVRAWNRPIDLLWIDGNHDYEAVKQDYEQWSPFVKTGGCIAFHDADKRDNNPGWTKYGWEGPTRLVKEKLTKPRWVSSDAIESIVWAVNNKGTK